MKIAVYGNQCQDHKVEEIRALFEALRASGAFIEVERRWATERCRQMWW